MLKLKKLIRIGTSKKPLKIIVLGARQSGKTTFFTVAYHNTLEKIGHKIKPVGSTIERVRKKMRELKNDKIKPTPIGKKEVYNFEFFKDGKENSHQLHFDWLDIAGNDLVSTKLQKELWYYFGNAKSYNEPYKQFFKGVTNYE